MRRIIERLVRVSPTTRIAFQAMTTAIVAYAIALLGAQVATILSLGDLRLVAFHAVVVVALVALTTFIWTLIRAYAEEIQSGPNRMKLALSHAHNLTDEWIYDTTAHYRKICERQAGEWVYVQHDPRESIVKLIQCVYNTLEAYFAETEKVGERIEFEVTFMTKSYRDNKITIAAWANRHGRMPFSLSSRTDNPDIYDRTITAEVYRMVHAAPRVIEDTEDPQYNYGELYDRQRDRIKSSIVYPVLSDRNELLGTLVLHCDRRGFFRMSDLKYWREMLEVYVKRIALEKLRLDGCVVIAEGAATPSSAISSRPPF